MKKSAIAAPSPTDEMTLRLTTEEGEVEVTIDFDFSTLSPEELVRVRQLAEGGNPIDLTIAFLFVKVTHQIDLEDSAFAGFKAGIRPLFEGDGSIVTWRED